MRKEKLAGIKERVSARVLEALDLSRDLSDEEIRDRIDGEIIACGKELCLSLREKEELSRGVFNSLRKLDVLQELMEDNAITEIMVNGPKQIFIEQGGRLRLWEKRFESWEKLEDVIQQMVSGANRVVNEASPVVDVRLKNGSRVNIVLPPVAINGPVVTIRRFPDTPVTLETLLRLRSINESAAGFLQKLVEARYNIFISGGTGSGKTTFLNVLSNFIPRDERVITIEDSAELQLGSIPNLVRLEARNATAEGTGQITIRDLIKAALRMRPDRIVVGEVRDEAAIDMLSAFNTGHDGSLSTGHANSPADMLNRLETLVLMGMEIPLMAVRRQIASAVDLIVHLGRLRDKSRKVLEITEVLDERNGEIRLNPLYVYEEMGEENGRVEGELIRTGRALEYQDKLARAGLKL